MFDYMWRLCVQRYFTQLSIDIERKCKAASMQQCEAQYKGGV